VQEQWRHRPSRPRGIASTHPSLLVEQSPRFLRAVLFVLALVLGAGASRALAQGETDTVHVRQKKLTLEEIIERCEQGEKTKLAGHRDMQYTVNLRVIFYWEKKKETRDIVFRAFSDDTGFSRSVKAGEVVQRYELRDSVWVVSKDEGEESGIQVESDGFGDFVEMPFFLEEQQEFHFTLLDRTVERDHVIFKIGFVPKSEFKALPSGTVYVDTDNYRIVHEEFDFETNPFPLLLKDIKGFSRHWEELPGGEWVYTRILMEVELRNVAFGRLPRRAAASILREDFEFDKGYDARIFGER